MARQMSEREDQFLDFFARIDQLMGGKIQAPILKEIVNAFEVCYPESKAAPLHLPTYDDAQYDQPFTVYLINNTINRRTYIGRAEKGFIQRYPPRGEWWNDHHNKFLSDDVQLYGVGAFRVHVQICEDEKHMKEAEAQYLFVNRLFTYNIRNEYRR